MAPSLSILLVDDNPSMREIVEMSLQAAGHKVVSKQDGREAIEELKVRTIDLIITDVLMPKMDGVEFIQKVHQQWPDIPLIAMSGGGERLPVEYCLKTARSLGAAATLEKPFTGSDLLAAVDEALAKKGRSPAGA